MGLIQKMKDAAAAVVAQGAEKISEKLEEALHAPGFPAGPESESPRRSTVAPEPREPARAPPPVEIRGSKARPAEVMARQGRLPAKSGLKVKRGQKHRHR